MTLEALAAFGSKILNPCRKFLQVFKFRIRKPVFIRALRARPRRTKAYKSPPKNRITALLTGYRSIRKSKEMERVRELSNGHSGGREGQLFPSPITPAYVKATRAGKREASGDDDVEDACRSFENYLVEMIAEEGKVRDLMDVEELLQCWKSLKSPVFIDLVCRFYGELCKDLFSTKDAESDSP
ncbi:transcription repressor OFP17-like [Juglans microcarpa x Juglans regia]|uniref:transcription repressor OFP17-like n=1 Tax=Juglans microcarpa x Juglans regia TaxID=2249226 RepID=UPI001B7EC209|nr:transcription repressor OFP17-like [Juglans microcarpa x Juglans regia]